jgi:hypothetical protein
MTNPVVAADCNSPAHFFPYLNEDTLHIGERFGCLESSVGLVGSVSPHAKCLGAE